MSADNKNLTEEEQQNILMGKLRNTKMDLTILDDFHYANNELHRHMMDVVKELIMYNLHVDEGLYQLDIYHCPIKDNIRKVRSSLSRIDELCNKIEGRVKRVENNILREKK